MWCILSLALLLRLPLLNQSLWLDESIEALALQGHFGSLLSYSLSDFQPPLYHFILLAWTRLFGFSEIALRIPSLLAGLALVYFVFKLGELIANKKVGIIASLLVATNPLLIYYSQEGRTYALTTFFVTASFYYFIKLIQDKNSSLLSTKYYVLSTTLFLWTSYLSWFVLLSQGLYVLWKKRFNLLIPQALSALTLIFWLPTFFSSLHFGLSDAAAIPAWSRVVGGISPKAIALTWVKMNLGRISFVNQYLYGLIALALLHARILRRSQSSILILWILAPIILASFISLWVPVYSYTRVLFVIPAYLLWLALGLSQLPRFFTYLATFSQLIFLIIFWFTPRFHREDWRQLTLDLNSQSNIVVALPSLKVAAPLSYYNLTSPLVQLQDYSPVTQPVYYLRYGEGIFDPDLLGQAKLKSSGYTITSQRVYPGIQLDIYENRH